MRIHRDQTQLDGRRVWCEWTDGRYHVEAHDMAQIEPVMRSKRHAKLVCAIQLDVQLSIPEAGLRHAAPLAESPHDLRALLSD